MDRKVCPDCGREFQLEDETCVDCGTPLLIKEDLNPEDYAIVFHDPIKENVDAVQADLAAHGVGGKVRQVNLSDFNISVRGAETWALLVPRDQADEALGVLHKLYGFTDEAEEEEAAAAPEQYKFLEADPEELADPANWQKLCEALRDCDLPEKLARNAIDALVIAGQPAEDIVLQSLVDELEQGHYAVRACSTEPFIEVLAEIGTEKSVAKLMELCTSSDSDVRINAVHALGEIGMLEHAPLLLPFLEDEDEDVRQEANAALEQMTGEIVEPEYILTTDDGKKARKEWEKTLRKK